MDGGVHECARQWFRSFTFFPAARSVKVVNKGSAKLVHQGEKSAPILKFVVKNLIPNVGGAGQANAKPKGCSPNVLLRSGLNGDFHDVVHEVAQFAGVFQRGEIGAVSRPFD